MPDKPQNPAIPPALADPDYSHTAKRIVPRPVLATAGRRFKWYDIAVPGAGVPAGIHQMARAFLEQRAEEGDFDQMGALGFVILHRCGDGFYFLIVCSWRGNNEIWESVFAKDKDDTVFRDWPRPGAHLPTYCVWEMGAVTHESLAWSRFLRGRRDEAAISSWLADQYDGEI